MKCKMLANWKFGALYLDGKVYDFSNLANEVPSPPQSVLEDAIESGYMELVRDGESIAEANIVSPLFIQDTVEPPTVTPAIQPKGRQPKET